MMQVSWTAGKGPIPAPVGANDVWSAYNLKFKGGCMDSALDSYGQGVSGKGPPNVIRGVVPVASAG